MEDLIPSVKRVAIWPVATVPMYDEYDYSHPEVIDTILSYDPEFLRFALWLSHTADSLLYEELNASGLFEVLPADSIGFALARRDSTFHRFDRTDWRTCREVVNADALLQTKVSYKEEGSGTNTYVVLSLLDVRGGGVIIESSFNTKWGSSYIFSPDAVKSLPDAICGAARAIIKEIKKHAE